MKPNVVTVEERQYKAGAWVGRNESGRIPIGDSVVILPDEASNKIGKLGLIEAPEQMVERHSLGSETGIIVAVGEGAFEWNSDRTRPFKGRKPTPGDRVHFARYSGRVLVGKDGKSYRIMSDNCVAAIEE